MANRNKIIASNIVQLLFRMELEWTVGMSKKQTFAEIATNVCVVFSPVSIQVL